MRKVLLLAAAAALSACGTVGLKIDYAPAGPAARLSAERLPRVYVDEATVTADFDIAMSWNRDAEWDPPAEQAVRDAFRAELARLGLPAAPDARQADAVLHPSLTVCEFGMPVQAAPTARIELGVTLKTPNGDPLWETTLAGRGRSDRVWVDADQARAALSRALTAAVGQLGGRMESEGAVARVWSGPRAAPGEPSRPAGAASDWWR